MADRNPFIPSERRQEMEERTQVNKEEANQRFGKDQARLEKEFSETAAKQAKKTKEKVSDEQTAEKESD